MCSSDLTPSPGGGTPTPTPDDGTPTPTPDNGTPTPSPGGDGGTNPFLLALVGLVVVAVGAGVLLRYLALSGESGGG